MKSFFILWLFFFGLNLLTYGQRTLRKTPPTSEAWVPFECLGRLYSVTFTNSGNDSILLKLGSYQTLENNDTICLGKASHCDQSNIGQHYDLDDTPREIVSCVNWYTLRLVKPGDTIHFYARLMELNEADTTRLYFFFTKTFTASDRELEFYTVPNKVYMMMSPRDFYSGYGIVQAGASNVDLAVGRNQE
jgi:hypothetical protein